LYLLGGKASHWRSYYGAFSQITSLFPVERLKSA
jgi:hypothetical protein